MSIANLQRNGSTVGFAVAVGDQRTGGENVARDVANIVENISLIHTGVAGGIGIGEVFLNQRAKNNRAEGCAAVVRGAIHRGCAARRDTTAEQLSVGSACKQLIGNIETNCRRAICGGESVVANLRSIHIYVGKRESARRGRAMFRYRQRGGKSGVIMLTVRNDVADDYVLESKIIRHLKVERVFQILTRRGVTAAHHRHAFLHGDGFVGQRMFTSASIRVRRGNALVRVTRIGGGPKSGGRGVIAGNHVVTGDWRHDSGWNVKIEGEAGCAADSGCAPITGKCPAGRSRNRCANRPRRRGRNQRDRL